MKTLLPTALAYQRAGLSVIPCRRAAKRPLVDWKPYQARRAATLELLAWFCWSQTDAVAIVTGPISSQLEVIDFDAPELFQPWCNQVQAATPGLLELLPIVRTPSGGYHVYYRRAAEDTAAAQPGNRKLAVDPERHRQGGKYTLIETRGAGGYVLAPPSSGYTLLQGDLTQIPLVYPGAYETLLSSARSFSRAPEIASHGMQFPRSPRPAGARRRPGDDYNVRGNVGFVLEKHGWRLARYQNEEAYWRRPGKRCGHGATFNYAGCNLFYVFTTNAPPFEPERAYSRFAVYTLLEHGGDYRQAALTLGRQGFGQ